MRTVHVVPSLAEEASGPTASVVALANAMIEAGATTLVVATGEPPLQPDGPIRGFPRRARPRRLGRSPEMRRWLTRQVASRSVDLLHGHGLWMAPNLYPGWATRRGDTPLVISPRGTLAAWALERSRLVKALFWTALQQPAIAHARLFHATAESEYEDIRRLGFRQPVAVIPNGVHLPPAAPPRPPAQHRTLLFLSRLHPKKGLDMLLDSWVRLEPAHPRWTLRIVGPGEPAYVRRLQTRAAALGLRRIVFDGPLYGPDKIEAYRSADLFVLPTFSENFGLAVAEALACGCPVVTTRGAPWSGLADARAGWWTAVGAGPLSRTLDEALSTPSPALVRMGARGRDWMARDFAWSAMAARMIEAYRWTLHGGCAPDGVRHD